MLKKVIILLLLSAISLYAIEEHKIKPLMDAKVKKVLLVLKNKSLSQKQKEKKSIGVMDGIFDYHTMAKISMGKRWKTLTAMKKNSLQKLLKRN